MTDPLDLGPIEPGEIQDWNVTWARARDHAARREAAFEVKAAEGDLRYQTDATFRRRVDLLAQVMFGKTRSSRIRDAIRGVVALEEMDGGVLDDRIPPAS